MVGRYSKSRRKVCQACSSTKSRCDRNPKGCSRCISRQLICVYFSPPQQICENVSREVDHSSLQGPASDILVSDLFTSTPNSSHVSSLSAISIELYNPNQIVISGARPETNLDSQEGFDFSNLELVCPIEAENIRNRWLNSYVPLPGQVTKAFPPNIASYVYNMLKSYTNIAVRGRGLPPFIHPLQISKGALCPILSTCLNLIRICDNPLSGSEDGSQEILRREMDNIFGKLNIQDGLPLLATFQAYLIYCMVLYFCLGVHPDSFLRQDMMNLQEIACFCCQNGVMCLGEQKGARPQWEAWMIAESKRRTLYVMYLFDNVLSIKDGLPTFLATEVRGLPAPADKRLWNARPRKDWEVAYNVHLADWTMNGSFRIDELWPSPVGENDTVRAERSKRLDHWLETIDEFGTMMFAVTSCIHGE